MWIEFNGDDVETTAATVADFLMEQDIGNAAVAVAVNGEFIPRARHASEPLIAGVRLEVVAPMQGG